MLAWHDKHARSLPWKEDRDPYKIWVSEIILQQTRIIQGLPYYHKFIARFPDIFSLAIAPEDDLMKVWEGLGYYSRARNMQWTARHIVDKMNGHFPDNYNDLILLKGIGPYTAAAISSFAFDEARAVVDGNVYRVISRYFGMDVPTDTTAGKKEFAEKAHEIIDPDQPGKYNQAIMDFGAMQCIPGQPDCLRCPFQQSCIARRSGRILELPQKLKKPVKKDRTFQYFVLITPDGSTIVRKRSRKDIWKGLYEFPMVEGANLTPKDLNRETLNLLSGFGYTGSYQLHPATVLHQTLSHQNITGHFHEVILNTDQITTGDTFYLVDYKNLCNFAFPKLIDWFIAKKTIPLVGIKLTNNDQ